MTIATKAAELLEPAPGRPGPQPMSTVPGPASIAVLDDRTVSRASHVFCLLTSLTVEEIEALAPGDRRLLQGQLERVHRMVTGTAIVRRVAAPEGGEPTRSRAAFLDELRDGLGRE